MQRHDDKYKALCTWCRKTIDFGKMAEGALRSHVKSGNHKDNAKTQSSVQRDAFDKFLKVSSQNESLKSSTVTCTSAGEMSAASA